MPRSSRHKSHKKSKSSKEDNDHSSSEEDMRVKEKSGGRGEGLVRVSRDSTTSEKRKAESHSIGSGVTSEERNISKRRKKANAADGEDSKKDAKGEGSRVVVDDSSKSKAVVVDSKSRSSRRNDNVTAKKEENVSKSGSKVELKQRSVKEIHQGKDRKESREKERKVETIKRDMEAQKVNGNGTVVKKERLQPVEPQNNQEFPLQDDLRNLELEKELEKRIRKRRDGSGDKYPDLSREDDDRQLSSRGELEKDRRYKEERHKEGKHGDIHQEDDDKDKRKRDIKHREDGDRNNGTKDDKYRKNGEDNKHKEDKYRVDSCRDNRNKDHRYQEDCDKDRKDYDRRVGKYSENGDKDGKHKSRDNKYHEDGDKYNKQNDKYLEDGERDGNNIEDKHWKEGDMVNRHTEDTSRDEVNKDIRHRNKIKDNGDKKLRVKSLEECTLREHTIEKSSSKRLRDESYAGELHAGKSNNRDGSPAVDGEITRSREDKRRKGSHKVEKEAHGDIRYRSTKDREYDAAKLSANNPKADIVTNRGRSYSRNADAEITSDRNKRRSSPSLSSHVAKDQCRPSRQEGSKYRDSKHEERSRLNRSSSKENGDDGHYRDELSVERRSLVVEQSRQKSGFDKEGGRGSRESAMEALPVNELSQADGDPLPISSPFIKTNSWPNNSRPLLPHPGTPYRTGPGNHYRRGGDFNIGSSPWKGLPNWPSPIANGLMPFQHGPPPLGFHPGMMHQFPAPIFGVRPSMELNHRFPSHGRPLGWRNPVDELYPPPLHGWVPNHPIFGGESHMYGRPEWDPNRTLTGPQDVWKGQNSGAETEPQKPDCSPHEVWTNPFDAKPQSEETQSTFLAEKVNVSQSSSPQVPSPREVPETVSAKKSNISEPSKTNDSRRLWLMNLSKLDISADLVRPELYNKCSDLVDMDQNSNFIKDNSKILNIKETMGAKVNMAEESYSASHFAAPKDSVFEKAMSLYKRHREENRFTNGAKLPIEICRDDDDHRKGETEKKECDPFSDTKKMMMMEVDEEDKSVSLGSSTVLSNASSCEDNIKAESNFHGGASSNSEDEKLPLFFSDVSSAVAVMIMPESENLNWIHEKNTH